MGSFGQRGRPSKRPLSDDPADPAVQRWQARQDARRGGIAQVHALATQGWSQRAVARHLGLSRRTVRLWLALEVPPDTTAGGLAPDSAVPCAPPRHRTRRTPVLGAHLRTLAAQGCSSYVEIARQTGGHRVSVSTWLRAETAASELCVPAHPEVVPAPPPAPVAAPPPPWTSWDEVRAVRAALKEQRGLFLRRPEHLSVEQQETLQMPLTSPIGTTLAHARAFLTD